MIAVHAGAGGSLRLVGDGSAVEVAFVDADWIPLGYEGAVPCIAAGDAAGAAGRLLASARHIVALLSETSGPVEVRGDGLIAHTVRAALSDRGNGAERPAAVVDCSGDPTYLLDALGRVSDLGLIVLAGEPLGRPLAVDLYIDVHRRGLRLIGAPRPDTHKPVENPPALERALEQLADAPPGEPLPRGAAWYRASADQGPLRQQIQRRSPNP
jgi:hypothetical protein